MKAILFSLVAGFATCVSLLLCVYFGVDLMFFSVVTVIVLSHLFSDNMHMKAIERLLGSLIGVFIMYWIVVFFQHTPAVVYILGSIFIILFLYVYFKSYFAYGIFFSAITICFMGAVFYIKDPSAALGIGINWIYNVIIGGSTLIITVELVRLFFKSTHPHIAHRKHQLRVSEHDIEELMKFDAVAFIRSILIVVSFFLLFAFNHMVGWDFLSMQSLIAVLVITMQDTNEHSFTRAFHRIRGVFLGTLIAMSVVEVFAILNWHVDIKVIIVIVSLIIMVLTFLGAKYHNKDYIYLQAAVLVALVLVPVKHSDLFNIHYARERSLGSLEGAVIGLVFVLLFSYILSLIRKKRKKGGGDEKKRSFQRLD